MSHFNDTEPCERVKIGLLYTSRLWKSHEHPRFLLALKKMSFAQNCRFKSNNLQML